MSEFRCSRLVFHFPCGDKVLTVFLITYVSSALIKSSWLRKRMTSWRKCWIWGRLQFSFCSRSSRTGEGFSFWFHLCLFFPSVHPTCFLNSLFRETLEFIFYNLSVQSWKKPFANFPSMIFPSDMILSWSFPLLLRRHNTVETNVHCDEPRGVLTSARDGLSPACQLPFLLLTSKPDPFHSRSCTLLSLSPSACCAFCVRPPEDDP